jgi:hypothetical protein
MTGPFLIAPGDEYWSSKPKIAFIGQETHGWWTGQSILNQMGHYREFNLGANRGNGKKYSSPFWQVIRQFEVAFTGDRYNSAWLNLNRYDDNRRRPLLHDQAIISELDFLLLEELRLLAPDAVIFFTGQSYDQRIAALLQAEVLPLAPFLPRQLCEFKSPLLSCRIFRTSHPKHLQLKRRTGQVIESIREEVKEMCFPMNRFVGDASELDYITLTPPVECYF